MGALTSDHEAATRSLDDAVNAKADAGETGTAWPKIHYLGPQHPVLDWLADKILYRIERNEAMDGDPFVPANVARLRRLAAVGLALPLLDVVATTIVARTLETDPRVDVIAPGLRSWTLIVVGLAVLALAEVFRSGSDLRQFERETV